MLKTNCLLMKMTSLFLNFFFLHASSLFDRKDICMKIAVCDVKERDRTVTAELLELYFSEHALSTELKFYESSTNLLYEIEDGCAYDLIFLDLFTERSVTDRPPGLDVARRLQAMHYGGHIIFLTARPDFAVESYEVGAGGYLLKPVEYDKLCMTLDRLLGTRDAETYYIRRRNGVLRIPYGDILYVESSNSKCTLYCSDGSEHVIYHHLSEIEKALNSTRFLRCHQSYLVNMDYICAADKAFLLTTGERILIRQRQLKELRQAYLSYVQRRAYQRRLAVAGQ